MDYQNFVAVLLVEVFIRFLKVPINHYIVGTDWVFRERMRFLGMSRGCPKRDSSHNGDNYKHIFPLGLPHKRQNPDVFMSPQSGRAPDEAGRENCESVDIVGAISRV